MILKENIEHCKSCYSDDIEIECHHFGENLLEFLVICSCCGCRTMLFDTIEKAVYSWNQDDVRVFDSDQLYKTESD